MKQQKFLIIFIVILVLLNLGTLGFLYFSAPQPPKPPHGDGIEATQGFEASPPSISFKLKEPLSLDDTQVKQIDSIHFAHVKNMRKIDDEFKNYMGKYFALLAAQTYSAGEKDSLQKELIHIHTKKLEASFSNYENIKRILRQDQQKIFSDMLPEITNRIMQRSTAPIPLGRPMPH